MTRPFGDDALTRRELMRTGLAAAAAMSRPVSAAGETSPQPTPEGARATGTVTSFDGTRIFDKDRGACPVVTFSHGWPLNSDAWTRRCCSSSIGATAVSASIGAVTAARSRFAHNDMDGYADDLAAAVPTLVLHGRGRPDRPVSRLGAKVRRVVKVSVEIYYQGAPWGLTATHRDRVNKDLLDFI